MTGRLQLGLFLCVLCVYSASARSANAALTPEQVQELRLLAGQLADPERSAKTKLEAAELLLSRTYPEAAQTLKQFLASPANIPAQIAIAQAISRHGSRHKELIEPLIAMLTGKEPSVRAAAARALVTYKNDGVTEKLVSIALEAKRDKAVRLVTVETLGTVIDKSAVDALVRLLDDPDANLQDTAIASLVKLTNIRAFGKDRYRWKLWWARNKNKPYSQWLADLADSLAAAKAALEAYNAQLRDRLAKAVTNLYAATPPAQQEAMLMGFLGDTLVDVRLVGVKLASDRVTANKELWPKVQEKVRAMLADEDPRLRGPAAMLVARLGGSEALSALLDRLKKEEVTQVREDLLNAMAHLRDPKAFPVVLKEIGSKYEQVAAAAAAALARIASKQVLEAKLRTDAVNTVVARYEQASKANDTADLREALLTAMGALGDKDKDKDVAKLLSDALKDPAATVRLAAVNALADLGREGAAEAIVALATDKDRGVRRAAIAALGVLGGQKYRQIILQRTDPSVEADAAVRQQAWDVVMVLLSKADATILSQAASSLKDRTDAVGQRIKILQLLVTLLKASKSADLPAAQLRLGSALLAASRPREAAVQLGEAYAKLASSGSGSSAAALAIWKLWVDALLAADDPAAIAAMADQKDPKAFSSATEQLMDRLAKLNEKEKFSVVMLLANEAIKQLPKRLTAPQAESLKKMVEQTRLKQLEADGKRVAYLVTQLVGRDESAGKAAALELQAMSNRAVLPLLSELKKTITDDKSHQEAEKAILAVVTEIAPKLTGYKADAPLAERVKLITAWQRQLLP